MSPFRLLSMPVVRATRNLAFRALLMGGMLALGARASSVPDVAQAEAAPRWAQATPSVNDHWMADASGLGRLQLGQVILPASHDTGTYGFASGRSDGPDPAMYTTNQDIDVFTQLQHGIRVLDLRGRKFTWDGAEDYYVYHGKDTTDLRLSTVLDDVQRWVLAPGHDKEVVIVQVEAAKSDSPARFDAMCSRFQQNLGGLMLTPASFAEAVAQNVQQKAVAVGAGGVAPPDLQFPDLGNSDLAHYTLNEVWSLPGKQRVIVNWSDCGPKWPDGTWSGYWANQCYAGEYSAAAKTAWVLIHPSFVTLQPPDSATFARPGIIGAIRDALNGRLMAQGSDGQFDGLGAIATQPSTFTRDALGNKVPVGFYSLGMHATITPECGYPLAWFLDEQAAALNAVKTWFNSGQFNARNYLDVISADYVEKSTLVDTAVHMNVPLD